MTPPGRSGDVRLKKSQLERILQGLDSVPRPRATIEQYGTPPAIAAEVLFSALARGDLSVRSVLDAGCGNGILAIGAELLGASRSVGIDIDSAAIDVARSNALRAAAAVEWRVGDIREVDETFDTILMNPPFGSQRRHADRPFFETALARGRVVHAFLNPKAEAYVRRAIEASGGRITDRVAYEFPVRHTFAFHRSEVRRIPVVLYRIEVAKR